LLPFVEKPSRYSSGEINLCSRGYTSGLFNVLLAFPDVYEIGMSYQGIRFLYGRLAAMEGVGVEFAFAPWPDLEGLMRRSGEGLRSRQTGIPASSFDLIGVSLTYELHYSNLLLMLDLAGMALESADREEDSPLVVSGGPCCTNPLPFLDAVDAVFLGDGEQSLPEAVAILKGLKKGGAGRSEMVESLAGIEGVYVDGVTESADIRVYGFEPGDLSPNPIVPSAGIVHNRLAVEVMRGCTRGCRFCQAGMICRPRRERSVDEITEAVCLGLDATGWEEVSLLSLSTSDYSRLDDLLDRISPELESRNVSLALPSLRPETVTERIVDASSGIRKSGFTLAPEAGTERLRRVINKGMSDEEILEGCRCILRAGWQSLKLYFMIGLPTETEDDLEGIVDLVGRILGIGRSHRRFRLGISVSPFVPKPHTPFQWERQCSLEELVEKERYISMRMKNRRIQLSQRDPVVSVLEAVLARGDRRLWPALVGAYRAGCRFDGWRDMLKFDSWMMALEKEGLCAEQFTSGFERGGRLPWSSFRTRVSHEHLVRERERAGSEELTQDCRVGPCHHCGACGGSGRVEPAQPRIPNNEKGGVKGHRKRRDGGDGVFRFRVLYDKGMSARFLSHREIINIFNRALRRSGLPLNFTEGFNPHPRLSMGPALAVGLEGEGEFLDIELTDRERFRPDVFEGLLPDGIGVTECRGPFTRKEGKLPPEAIYRYVLYFDTLGEALAGEQGECEWLSGIPDLCYLTDQSRSIENEREALTKRCAEAVTAWFEGRLGEKAGKRISSAGDEGSVQRPGAGFSIRKTGSGAELLVEIPVGENGGVKPKDLIEGSLPANLAGLVRIKRIGILYKKEESYLKPIDLIMA